MKLLQLTVRSFRNMNQESLGFAKGLNIFCGDNGQGKTNLVESIGLLCTGSSFRTKETTALVQHGDSRGFSVLGVFEKKGLEHQVSIQFTNQQKKIQVNNKKSSSVKLRQNFPMVLFSPESLLVVKLGPGERRNLVDDVALQINPQFALIYEQAQRILKQKNTLLKKIRENSIDQREGHRLFHNLTHLLIAKSARIAEERKNILGQIQPILQKKFAAIMGDSLLELNMNYLVSGETMENIQRKSLVDAMYKQWETLQSKELASGQSLVGYHRHDIRFNFNGQEARFFCSQGQQRAIILAFKMAHIELHYAAHGMYPVLLLDDVLSEFDRMKQRRFLDYLEATNSQIFLTTTESFDGIKVPKNIFDVHLGRFSGRKKPMTDNRVFS